MNFEDYGWPSREGLKPFNHQLQTTKFLLGHKRAFVLNDLGTGKTLNVLWWTDLLMQAGKINRVIIACPLSTMKLVWAKELFFNLPHRRYAIAHGTRNYRIQALKSNAHYVIVNHDGVRVIFHELMAHLPDVLIIDELTAFKSHDAERTKLMMRYSHKCKCVIGMTGEPTPNSPLEAYSQAKIVNPNNPNLPRFFTQYRNMTMYQINDYVWQPKPEAPNIVAQVLQPAVRYRRDECLDLPPTMREDFEVPFTDEQAAAYEKMKREAYLEFEQGKVSAANAAVVLNKLLQIGAGCVKLNDGTVARVNCKPRLDMLLETFEQTTQRKLVIFTTFIASVEMLVEFLNKQKIKALPIYGAVSLNQRTDFIRSFQEGDTNALVIQPQSSAHGISLVAANTTVWFSLIASNEIYGQANARTVRPGQKLSTLILRYLSSKAEKHFANILDRRGKFSEETLSLFQGHML